jgi:hypothetical protein
MFSNAKLLRLKKIPILFGLNEEISPSSPFLLRTARLENKAMFNISHR